jgi:hypothetical protein
VTLEIVVVIEVDVADSADVMIVRGLEVILELSGIIEIEVAACPERR